jgi:hypothetical protein
MVNRILCAILLYLCFLVPAAAGELALDIEQDSTELGLPVVMNLYGISLSRNLTDIDLTTLKQDFGIVIKDDVNIVTDSRWPGTYVQQLQLLLYPRSLGELEIPVLALDGQRTSRRSIRVTRGMAGGNPIAYKQIISRDSVWQRQQVLVTVAITTPDRFASLHIDEPQIPGFEISRIPSTREDLPSGQRLLRTGWALFPLTAGQQYVNLPPVKYQLNGVFKRYYYLPRQYLDVKAMPPYIPPTVPVGRITIESSLEPAGLLRSHNLAYLDIRLAGETVLPYWFPAVLRQIRSNDQLKLLPADSTRQLSPDFIGVQGNVHHRIPFKPLFDGYTELPEINYHYFDPETSRLVTIKHQLGTVYAIGLAWRFILAVLLVLLLMIVGNKLRNQWRSHQQYRQQRRAAFQLISSAESAGELRSALRKLAAAEKWPANLALSDWLRCWRRHYQADPGLADLVQSLSSASYSTQQNKNIDSLRDQLHLALRSSARLKQSVHRKIPADIWRPDNFVVSRAPTHAAGSSLM